MGNVSGVLATHYLASKNSHLDSLVIGDWYTDLVVTDSVQHLERLSHRDKVTWVVQVHKCTSKLSSLALAWIKGLFR